jgi:isopenicillin N synthase-like dioxygenase
MSAQTIPVVDLEAWLAGGASRDQFVRELGAALADTGFFAVKNHGVPDDLAKQCYATARTLFHLPTETKSAYHFAAKHGQRGYTGFGREHAKDSRAPDLKEFWQIGRPDVGADHPVHAVFGPNVWPREVPEFAGAFTELYRLLDDLGGVLLEAAALHIGEPANRFSQMAHESDTIVRVLYYPPVAPDAPPGAVRSAAHEDINLITLLSGATAEGLELLERDGTWRAVHTGFDTIVVDAGDMLQNVTNGLYKSTTHRVVNPPDSRSERFSLPCFVHARREVDLTPLPSCVARTGGVAKYPGVTAGEYLAQRLREIGLS